MNPLIPFSSLYSPSSSGLPVFSREPTGGGGDRGRLKEREREREERRVCVWYCHFFSENSPVTTKWVTKETQTDQRPGWGKSVRWETDLDPWVEGETLL